MGVRQGECLSPFLLSVFLNDIEDEFMLKGASGVNLNTFKLFLLLYADDIVIFSDTAIGLQNGLEKNTVTGGVLMLILLKQK